MSDRIHRTTAVSGPNYTNPWEDSPGFIYLGSIDQVTIDIDSDTVASWTTTYDLYALDGSGYDRIAFGARFSDDPPDYLSGGAGLFRDMGITRPSSWAIDSPIAIAARAYVWWRMFGEYNIDAALDL